MKTPSFLALIFGALLIASSIAQAGAPEWRYTIETQYPHDPSHFTQGLLMHDDLLIEGTGGYGQSALYFKRLETGETLREYRLPRHYFGEGVTVVGDTIWQLTWRERALFVHDFTPRPIRQWSLRGEGWGLTNHGDQIWMTDGSAALISLDPETGAELGRVTVRDGNRRITLLNELEYVRGLIFANIFLSDDIAIIRPDDGTVVGWLRLRALRDAFTPPPDFDRREHVLNGIAWDAERQHLLVTGKCWPTLFALRLEPPEGLNW